MNLLTTLLLFVYTDNEPKNIQQYTLNEYELQRDAEALEQELKKQRIYAEINAQY